MFLDRRHFINACGRLDFVSTLLPGVLYTIAAEAETSRITAAMIDDAAAIAGIAIEPEQKAQMLAMLNANRTGFDELRALNIGNDVPPAIVFDPMPPGQTPTPPPGSADLRKPLGVSPPAVTGTDVPKDLNRVAFYTVRDLGELVRRRKVSSLDLTQMYLARLKKFDPKLHFVVTLSEDRGFAQAKDADAEIAKGRYRGALHGIP